MVVSKTPAALKNRAPRPTTRLGTVFKLVERDERVFHVYGSGKEKVVVEVSKKDAAAATGGATPTTT